MTALTGPRSTPRRSGLRLALPVASGVTVHQGGLTARDAAGAAVPAGHASAARVLGMATASAATGQLAEIERGTFRFQAFATDAPTAADIGNPAYAVDDQTVAKSDGGTGRLPAGVIRDVDAAGVWIEL
jgi:hypothetical protein